MSEDSFPGSSADFYERIQVLTAEIERLKGESAIKESAIRDLCAIARDKNTLITELADALEEQSCWSIKVKLIQRAREASK
jgi:hypothetical protein